MSWFALSTEYLCYGSTAIINILIFSVRGPTIDVRIGRLKSVLVLKLIRYDSIKFIFFKKSSRFGISLRIHVSTFNIRPTVFNIKSLKVNTKGKTTNHPHSPANPSGTGIVVYWEVWKIPLALPYFNSSQNENCFCNSDFLRNENKHACFIYSQR